MNEGREGVLGASQLTWPEHSRQSYRTVFNNTIDKDMASRTLYGTTNSFIRILDEGNSL